MLDRQLGVTVNEDGTLDIVDGRQRVETADGPDVIDEPQPKELATEYDEKEMKRRSQKGRKKKGGR